MPHSEVPTVELNEDGTISITVSVRYFPPKTPILISGQATQDNGAVAGFHEVRSMPELSEGQNEGTLTVQATPGPNVEFERNKKITVVAQASLVWSTTLKPVLNTPLNLWSVESSDSAVWPPQPPPGGGGSAPTGEQLWSGQVGMPPALPPDFRVASPAQTRFRELGPLGELPGTWSGHGFNLIARPDHQQGNDIFLELNLTDEHLVFGAIGGAIPNRGSKQDDIEIFGIHYLQQISDSSTGGAIHIEPGLWLFIPATTIPSQKATVARLATIAHGASVLSQGISSSPEPGAPRIGPANTVPFAADGSEPGPEAPNPFREYDLSQENDFRTKPIPEGVKPELVKNPNSLLLDDIEGLDITETVQLNVSSICAEEIDPLTFGPGAQYIPFLGKNAAVGPFHATFWVEKVQCGDQEFLQLQYSQTVLLNFANRSWPHVSVATLKKVT